MENENNTQTQGQISQDIIALEQQVLEKRQQDEDIKNNDNTLVEALVNNETAIDIAKQQYSDLKNQKQIAKKMGNVVNRKTNADIETANLLVSKQEVNNKVEKTEQANKILKLKQERKYLKREQKHRLTMQRAEHLKEQYGDLLLRTCRKKAKGEDGKWHYQKDENGKDIINVPGRIRFFFIRLFDGIVSGLNQTAEIIGALNKNVIKGVFIIIVLLIIFVPPLRAWLLNLIGIG